MKQQRKESVWYHEKASAKRMSPGDGMAGLGTALTVEVIGCCCCIQCHGRNLYTRESLGVSRGLILMRVDENMASANPCDSSEDHTALTGLLDFT